MKYRYHIASVDVPGHHQAVELDSRIWKVLEHTHEPGGIVRMLVVMEEEVRDSAEPAP